VHHEDDQGPPARARVAVGYTATEAGRGAVAAGARLARALGADLHLVLVVPDTARGAVVPPDPGYEVVLRTSAASWLEEAAALVPADVPASTRAVRAESAAEGLLEAAHEVGATHLVVGAGSERGLARFGVGTAASELLHSADLPVVVVPLTDDDGRGGGPAAPALSRVTVAVGTRPGADVLLEEGLTLGRAAGAPLRLVSLQVLDLPGRLDDDAVQDTADAHLRAVLDEARAAVPDALVEEALVVRGRDVTDAVGGLDWRPGEVVVVGSSRLAAPHRLFLGATAARLLRAVPVPVVVVPRTRPEGGPA